MNIYEISEKAGVSIATVSRVLNGSAKVSEKTRKKILQVMEENNYQPNVFARGLGLNSMNTIGILCADSSDVVLASAVYAIEQELRKNQYDALLCCTGYDTAMKEKYLKLLLSKRVDALILAGSNFVEAVPEKNQYIIDAAKEVPVIIMNGWLEAPNVYCTLCDDVEAMQRVTMKFLKHTERILWLYRSESFGSRSKTKGVVQGFRLTGRELPDEQSVLFHGSIDETKQMLMHRWERGERWDVILTSDDELAVGAYKFSRMAELKVPEELQIVGYNNSIQSICCEPEITSIDNHMDYLGQSAVSMLMKVLDGEQIPARVAAYADIVVRGTTKDL